MNKLMLTTAVKAEDKLVSKRKKKKINRKIKDSKCRKQTKSKAVQNSKNNVADRVSFFFLRGRKEGGKVYIPSRQTNVLSIVMALREITGTINVRSPSNFEAQKNKKIHIPRAINLENRDEKVDTTSRKPMPSQL